MLKLKLQYFDHLMGRTDSLEKNLMLGKIIAALQACLFITNSQNSPKLMSIESRMPSNHHILCHPLFLLLSKIGRAHV